VALALALESILAVVAAMHVTNVEFRLAALGAFVALALVGPTAMGAGPDVAETRVVVASPRPSRLGIEAA
jgi:hypothetical protein